MPLQCLALKYTVFIVLNSYLEQKRSINQSILCPLWDIIQGLWKYLFLQSNVGICKSKCDIRKLFIGHYNIQYGLNTFSTSLKSKMLIYIIVLLIMLELKGSSQISHSKDLFITAFKSIFSIVKVDFLIYYFYKFDNLSYF